MRDGQKFTIFDENGDVKVPKEGAAEKLHTICATTGVLAYELDALFEIKDVHPATRERFLMLVDIIYDYGRRMGNKLRDDHKKYKKPGGGWRNTI